MRNDAWYAAVAAFGLMCVAGVWGFVKAPELAAPKDDLRRARIAAEPPKPPRFFQEPRDTMAMIETFATRDPFSERSVVAGTGLMRLSRPRLAAPTRRLQPPAPRRLEDAPIASPAPVRLPRAPEPPRLTAPAVEPAPPPQPAARAEQEPTQDSASPSSGQGMLVLRGVFPSPNGGRALLAMPDGRLVSVGLGGVVGGWTVIQIGQGAVRLGRDRRSILLAMPSY